MRIELELSDTPGLSGKAALGDDDLTFQVAGMSKEAEQELRTHFIARSPLHVERRGEFLIVSDEPTAESRAMEISGMILTGDAGDRTITFQVIEAE